VRQLSADIRKVLSDPAVKQQLAQVGAEAKPSSPDEFGHLIQSEIAKWGEVVRKAGITAE
jgi:tripartite-type tricarboxylate transporter receptor subunit TctC